MTLIDQGVRNVANFRRKLKRCLEINTGNNKKETSVNLRILIAIRSCFYVILNKNPFYLPLNQSIIYNYRHTLQGLL